jgi:hypothetical protein
MKKCTIELCSGTESFSKVAREHLIGHSAYFTIDYDPFHNATFEEDILVFDYKTKIPVNEWFVTHVWCSPPCTHYSSARTTGGPRNLELADSYVQKCLEIIQYYTSHCNEDLTWFIENPANGLLKTRPFMQELNPLFAHRVDYCAYESAWGLKKGTLIWSNKKGFEGKRCLGAKNCPACIPSPYCENRYVHRHTPRKCYWNCAEWKSPMMKKVMLGRVPPQLIKSLLNC